MEELRASLPDTEEGWQNVRFEDIPIDASATGADAGTGRFDRDDFERNAIRAAEHQNVPYYRDPLPGNRLVVFVKKVFRKLIRSIVEPITQDCTAFQQAAGRCLSSLRRYISEQLTQQRKQEAELASLRRQVEELSARVRELEKK